MFAKASSEKCGVKSLSGAYKRPYHKGWCRSAKQLVAVGRLRQHLHDSGDHRAGWLGAFHDYCGNRICIFTSEGGFVAAISNAATESSNANVRVINGFTSIVPEASIAMQRGKTWA
jgi:hypothetical protein